MNAIATFITFLLKFDTKQKRQLKQYDKKYFFDKTVHFCVANLAKKHYTEFIFGNLKGDVLWLRLKICVLPKKKF